MQNDEVLLLFGIWSDSQLNYLNSLILPEGKVQTYGYTKNRNELAQLYTMADVFVNVTREDSLSLINVEAQACGTPVVTFDQTGVSDTVSVKYGDKITPGNSEGLCSSIRALRKNPPIKK